MFKQHWNFVGMSPNVTLAEWCFDQYMTIVVMGKCDLMWHTERRAPPMFGQGMVLYYFELFGVSRVTGPLDGAEIGDSHRSHWPWPAVTKYSLRTQAWAYPAENLVRRKLARITRHTGLCRSKISAQWSRVTGHAKQFEMVQYVGKEDWILLTQQVCR